MLTTFLLWFTAISAQAVVNSLLYGWLTAVDFDEFLSDIESQLGDIRNPLGDTSSMDTAEIVAAIDDAGFYPSDAGWMEDVGVGELIYTLYDITIYLNILASETGMNLNAFPHLGALEVELEKFGFAGLYSFSDIAEYLQESLNSLPSDSQYYSDLESIIEALSEDDPSYDNVMLPLGTLIDELQSEVDGGEANFVGPLENLEVSYAVLELFTEDPTRILIQLSEELETLFSYSGFEYNGLGSELGSNWLRTFTVALKSIFEAEDETCEVCPDDFVEDTLRDEYNSIFFFLTNCREMVFGEAPDCQCLNGANLYNNPLKEDVVSSLNCLYLEGDDLTVEQTLLICNGEEIEVTCTSVVEEAFEQLQHLARLLFETNFFGESFEFDFVPANVMTQFQNMDDFLGAIRRRNMPFQE